ncbi:MAG: hypothetical protein JSV42_13025 [Chloroflexota bacterium]|nr:MAG: hypothetical protein JSV42_13025 [Chloroflexota bacterium]
MSHSFKLFRLQQIDSTLDKNRTRLKEIEQSLKDESRINASMRRLDKAKTERFEAEKRLRLAEENVKDQRLKIERSQAALYGGKIVNPKELQDLQHESEALRRHLVTLEDRQLEAMFAFDEAEDLFKRMEDQLEQITAQDSRDKDELSLEKANLLAEIDRQENERQAASVDIVSPELQLYEALRKQKNGIAVARVLEKSCSACGSTLTGSTFSSAQVPSKITRCTSCGRILYAG